VLGKQIVIICSIFLLAVSSYGGTESLAPDGVQDFLLARSLDLAFIDSFPTAIAGIDSLIALDPQYWPAKIIKAGLIYMEMTDDEDYHKQRQYRALIDSSIAGLDEHLAQNPNDAWASFFYGTVLGYEAVWEGQHGSWLKAVTTGLKSGKYFSKAIKLNPKLYDAYVGLGTLHYWRSAKMGFLRYLPFVPDQRKQGIEELLLAKNKARYSSKTAALGLGWIYYDKKDYSKVVELTDSMLVSGKISRQVLWLRAMANYNGGRYDEAIKDFTLIKESLIRKGNQNYYNLITCGYYLGISNYVMGDKLTALRHFDEISSYKLSPHIANRAAKKLSAVQNYRQKIIGNQ
jgi:tetratricopeptide (TPR) repeat protein